jgi:hypothetical protein
MKYLRGAAVQRAEQRATSWATQPSIYGTRVAASNSLGTTVKYLQRTTSAAAGSSLGNTIKYLKRTTCGNAGNGLGTTTRYLRRTTSGAACNGRAQRSITCAAQRAAARAMDWDHNQIPVRRRGNRPGNHDQVPAWRYGHRPGIKDQLTARCREHRPGHHG